ncbi:murein hydrolase activator EnvC family protein [Fusibacter sp. JL298sf-3]
MGKRLLTAILALVLVVSLSAAYANDELKRRERELEELKQQMNNLDASIDANKALQSETNQKISNVNHNIRTLESEMNALNGQIDVTENAIVEKEAALKASEIAIVDKNDLLEDRLRVMYKTGSIGYLEVLFGSEDFNDLLSRVDMIQKVLIHDQNLLVELKEARDDIATRKKELEATKDNLLVLFKEKVSKQKQLNSSLQTLVAYKEDLKEDEAALAEFESQLLKEADQLTAIIKNLELSETYIGGEMMWPVPGHYNISSPFGERIHPITKVYSKHTGIDIPASKGTPVVAAQTGTVVFADWFGTYGKAIIIDHGGGYTTLYGHNSAIYVKVGQAVRKGDTIAGIGSTGGSTGNHCHFEVRENGNYVNPLNFVKKK